MVLLVAICILLGFHPQVFPVPKGDETRMWRINWMYRDEKHIRKIL